MNRRKTHILLVAACLLTVGCDSTYYLNDITVSRQWPHDSRYPDFGNTVPQVNDWVADPWSNRGGIPDEAQLAHDRNAGGTHTEKAGDVMVRELATEAATPATTAISLGVDGATVQECNATELEMEILLANIISLSHRGQAVSMGPQGVVDNTVVDSLETTSVDQVTEWTRNKVKQGYAVTITYNRDTGIYRCVARRVKKKDK